jgi:uncharacterized protein YndB with AHSA1/START domain
MNKSTFVYVTYIRTTPEKLWQALLDPSFTRQYWVECWHDCNWQVGADWKLMIPDGRVGDAGKIIDIEPMKRIVLTWTNQFKPELKAEGESRLTIDLEQMDDMMKLSLVHEIDQPDSKLIGAVSGGWPMILASLKSLLETGDSLAATKTWPKGM